MRSIAEVCADIDAEQPVPREEAEAVVRAVEKRCMGPFKGMSERTLRDLLTRLGTDTQFTEEARGHAVRVTQGAAKEGGDAPGILAALRGAGLSWAANLANTLLRAGCGQDVNEVILAGPLDGDVHEYTCPACGNEGTYRAPFIQVR